VSNSYDLTQFGGRMLHAPSAPGFYACEEAGVGEVWWFGWGGEDTVAAVDPHAPDYADRLTAELMDGAAAQRAGDGHQRFAIRGSYAPGGKAYLWEASKLANGGNHFRAFRQITGSCFPGGTPVRMADGSEKAIEAVLPGEEVVTHTGQRRRVVDTMTRLFTGELVTLHVAGFAFPLQMTADHQVAVMRGEGCLRWRPGRLSWVRADEIREGDRVIIGWDREQAVRKPLDVAELLGRDRAIVLDDLMEKGEAPVSNIGMAQRICRNSGVDWRGRVKLVRSRTENALLRHVPVSPSLGRLIGLYLAEGGCDSGRVVFTLDAKEESLAGEILALVRGLFGVEGEIVRQSERPTVLKVRFSNNSLEAVFKSLMPGDVYTKRVPGLFFGADDETKRALILGWMDGDGYATMKRTGKKAMRLQGVTVCAGLARDMATLALSCGIKASVSRRKPRNQSRAAYDVYLGGDKALSLFPALAAQAQVQGVRPHATDTNRCQFGYCRPVKRIEREAVTGFRVFDFEVEEDHSFIAGGLAVHNCVGNGLGQAVWYLSAWEVARLNDPEQVSLPFWLLAYGKSRQYAGMRGRGEGSWGTTAARAAREDGFVGAAESGLPQPSDEGGLTWGRDAELTWSDGAAVPAAWLEKSRKHLIKTTAQCKSAEDVAAAVQNGYPCTIASNWGGAMRPSVVDGVLLNMRKTTWNHQMMVPGWWDHPTLGEIFYILNSWGVDTHGTCPSGAPPGGFWIRKADMEAIVRQEETFALSQFDGFPSQDFSWLA
jgi:hypothetical protein